MPNTSQPPEEIESVGNKAMECNHFMVWNIQSGYSYYRCSKCTFIDGEKTFKEALLKSYEAGVAAGRASMYKEIYNYDTGFLGGIVADFNSKFQMGKDEGHISYAGITYVGEGQEMSIQDFVLSTYAKGRLSMKKEIEAVVLEKENERILPHKNRCCWQTPCNCSICHS